MLPVLLAYGFRPFFLLAGTDAAVTIALWMLSLRGDLHLPSTFPPLAWHVHEMLFGFVAAAIGGFLLTAVANWTNRPPVRGTPLMLLVLAWLLGRVAVAVGASLGWGVALAVDLAFLALLALIAGREIVIAGNRRNLPMVAALVLLAIANAAMHLEAAVLPELAGAGQRLAIGVIVLLIALIGGRIVPTFTRNWLAARGEARLPAAFGPVDRAAIAVTAATVALWSVLPGHPLTAAAAGATAVLHAWRLARWCGGRTLAEPLLAILHLGYGWLVPGFGLLALCIVTPGMRCSAAMHALTAGAMGTMILAVATRATLGHTGRALHAGPVTTALFAAVTIAALARVAAGLGAGGQDAWLDVAAGAWIVAWLGFLTVYGRMLVRPRLDGGPG
jgi:uncharacterized protein involved in response to NO